MGSCAGSSPKREVLFARKAGGSSARGPGRARSWDSGETDWMANSSFTVAASAKWSLSAWIKTTAEGPKSVLSISNGTATDGIFVIYMNTAEGLKGWLEQDVGTGDAFDHGGAVINDGEWHHIAGAVDEDLEQMSLWRDGVAAGLNPFSFLASRTFPTITDIGVGCRVFSSTQSEHWVGDIDECSVWDAHYLTDAEAAALNALGRNNSKRYFDGTNFGDATITAPQHHYSLSDDLNPGAPGTDSILPVGNRLNLTDNGTDDVEGIPAGD